MAEASIDGRALQLVTLWLFDGPDAVTNRGEPLESAPVVSHLRPDEARELAFDLLCLAESAERRGEPGR